MKNGERGLTQIKYIEKNPLDLFGGPNGSRTRVTDVRGRCPRPLDDGTLPTNQFSMNNYQFSINQYLTKLSQYLVQINLQYIKNQALNMGQLLRLERS